MLNEVRTFSHQLSSNATEIAELFDLVAGWAKPLGVGQRTINYLILILDELVANIATHAYGGHGEGRIEIVASYDGASVCVTLRDHGPPFDPSQQAPANVELDMDDREIGGLGIHFVRRIADQLSYRRDGDVNEIVFCKSNVVGDEADGHSKGNGNDG